MKDAARKLHPPKQRRFLRFKQLKEMGVASDYAVLYDLIKKHNSIPATKFLTKSACGTRASSSHGSRRGGWHDDPAQRHQAAHSQLLGPVR